MNHAAFMKILLLPTSISKASLSLRCRARSWAELSSVEPGTPYCCCRGVYKDNGGEMEGREMETSLSK